MVPGAVANWIDASSLRYDPTRQVSAFTVREVIVVFFDSVTAVRIFRIAVSFGPVLASLVLSTYLTVRTHQLASLIPY